MNKFKVFTFTCMRDLSLVRQLNNQITKFENVEHFMYIDQREFDIFPKDFKATIRKREPHDGNPFGGEGFRKKFYCMKDMKNDVQYDDTWMNVDSDVKFKNEEVFKLFKCNSNEVKASANIDSLNINGIIFNHMSGALQCLGGELFHKLINLDMKFINEKIKEVDEWGQCPGDDVMIGYFSQGVFGGNFTNYRTKLNIDASRMYETSTADIIW